MKKIFLFSISHRASVFYLSMVVLCFGDVLDFHSNNYDEPCDAGPCDAGEKFVVATNSCLSCDVGTFIDIRNHSCVDCRMCTHPVESDNEIAASDCTRTSDTIINCRPNHFRLMEWESVSCEPCSRCTHGQAVVKECSNNTDTVCQWNDTTSTSDRTSDDHRSLSVINIVVIASVALVTMTLIIFAVYLIRHSKLCIEGGALPLRINSRSPYKNFNNMETFLLDHPENLNGVTSRV